MIATLAAMKSRRGRKAAVSWGDSRLIQPCLDSRQDAWNELVDRYGRLVYSITRRCGARLLSVVKGLASQPSRQRNFLARS